MTPRPRRHREDARQQRERPIPSVEAASSCIELDAVPHAARRARSHARQFLAKWHLDELSEDVELVVSELVTNAVVHQADRAEPRGVLFGQDARRVSLTLRHTPGQLVIAVFDANPDPPVRADAGPEAESGRGLVLVEALSKEWSFALVPSGGKVTYCVINA